MEITCPRCRQTIDTPGERILGICSCGVGLFFDPYEYVGGGTTHAVYPPDGFELVGPGEEVLPGDIHFDIGPGDEGWDFDYPIWEERITTDRYPLIARPVRPDRGGPADPQAVGAAAPRGPAVQLGLFEMDG